MEPSEVTPELIKTLSKYREFFCDHFHLPLQSGSNSVLKRMRRNYTTEEYEATVALIREYFPDCQVSADVIPGFPGESCEEFEQTLKFVSRINLNQLHVFP